MGFGATDSLETSAEFLPSHELPPDHLSIGIPDTGSQYGFDIEQKLKRLGVNAVRLPFDTPIETLYGYGGIIIPGGPESVYEESSPKTDPRLFSVKENRPPVLGICYGSQLINFAMGGTVEKLPERQDGYRELELGAASTLLADIDSEQRFVTTHGDTITNLAPGFVSIANTNGLNAGIANDEEQMYGLQFHPEVSPPAGDQILANFIHKICGLESTFEYGYQDFVEDAINEAREFIGDKKALLFISGGVDSSAVAKLLEQALPPEQVKTVLVDHGFMRQGEVDQVVAMLNQCGIQVQVFDAAEQYMHATTRRGDGTTTPPLGKAIDPEDKRNIMGDKFISIQQEEMAEVLGLGDDYILVMGSLYTDLIESGSSVASKGGTAAKIKTHHNDTAEARKMRDEGRIYEPWRFIQKDDVREVGRLLGLNEEIYRRQPFPGPGLAIRILCGTEPYCPENTDQVTAQLNEFCTDDVRAHLLPIKSVGLQGDSRTYAHAVGLTGPPNWRELKDLTGSITDSIHDVNRVAYIFGEPLSAVEQEITPTQLEDPEVVPQLLVADEIVNDVLATHGLTKTLSQVPVILTPLSFGEEGKRSIVIRTFMTTNFKAGDIAMPGIDIPEEVLFNIVEGLSRLRFVSRVLYDLTSKPPGTTEWE